MKKVAGVDEVGRGSLVGPVCAAAVIFKKNIDKSKIKDSKKLSKEKRNILEKYIKKNFIGTIINTIENNKKSPYYSFKYSNKNM